MPTYIALVDWTDQGIKTVSAAVERADKGAEIAKKHGARFLEHYWTTGPYDVVAICAMELMGGVGSVAHRPPL